MMEVQILSEKGLGKLPLVARLILRHVHVNSTKIFRDENYLSINNSHSNAKKTGSFFFCCFCF